MGGLVAPNGAQSGRTALRVTAGPAVGQLILVDDELTLGSSQKGVGALGGDTSLSSAHAVVTRDHTGEWLVRDLGSADGTFLNGRPLSGLEPLHRGDTLRLGTSKLVVVEGSARTPRPRVSVPVRPSAPTRQAAAPSIASQPTLPDEPPPPPIAQPRPHRKIASDSRRLAAALIDGVIATGIVVGLVEALGFRGFSGLIALAVVLAWDFLFESLRGQTIGKRVMKIRVVRRDGSRFRPQHAAARNVLRILDGLPGVPIVGLLSMTISGRSRRQRIGDLAAGTIVVESERAMSRLPESRRDRLILAGYPVLWLTPVIVWALLTPGATEKLCRKDILSAHPPEETCLAADAGGQKLLITAVNAGHTLHWNGYDIRLLATRAKPQDSTGDFQIVGLKLALTNTRAQPAIFDQSTELTVLNVPNGSGGIRSSFSDPRLRPHDALVSSHPISPAATRRGWVNFVLETNLVPHLNATLASVSFMPRDPMPGGLPHLGNIRLWNPATPQGARAVLIHRG